MGLPCIQLVAPVSLRTGSVLGLAARPESSGFDATTGILVVLAAIAGYLVYEFIRDNRGRSGIALVGAVAGHLLLLLFLSLDIAGRVGCGVQDNGLALIEFEVAEVEQPKPKEKPPEPEPEPEPDEPEQPKEVEPEQIKQPKPKTKKAPEQKQEPINQDPAPPKRWDLSAANGNGPVVVPPGSGGEYGGAGNADSKGKGPGKPAGDPKGDEKGTASVWQPRSELFIKELPKPVKVPKIECPASASLGVQGDVILKVQIGRDGKIRDVSVLTGIGQGCDQIAVKALKQARFKAAIGTNGQPVDFELRYEYAFTVNN
ncbi:energy transducer TonB [Enhygromyxa salina]|uniref:Transport protein TonB n=1 Tax=Enhygromyxa salina TaxID=215803 RepID=A0A2S9XTN8_9BACT|nr:energy transducer TonB [Enhygromyxa salina]PRP96212.1 transport protein TonB [Enhygromyxa salina]